MCVMHGTLTDDEAVNEVRIKELVNDLYHQAGDADIAIKALEEHRLGRKGRLFPHISDLMPAIVRMRGRVIDFKRQAAIMQDMIDVATTTESRERLTLVAEQRGYIAPRGDHQDRLENYRLMQIGKGAEDGKDRNNESDQG